MSATGRCAPFESQQETLVAYQFAHTQTYSRKGNGKSRSVASVVAEAVRQVGYCPHVEEPLQPNILHGISPDAIPSLIEQQIETAKACFAEQLKGKGRGIRQDQHVLEAAVFSHPNRSSELSDPDVRARYQEWRDDVIEWVKNDFASRGLDFVSAVEHLDESHPHIHAYGVPRANESNPRMDAKLCHAGYAAKASESVLERKNTAYREAMRSWQDNHYQAVSVRHGLLRYGPKRARLDRQAYTAQKIVAKDLAEKLKMSDQLSSVEPALHKAKSEHSKLLSEIKSLRQSLAELGNRAIEEALKVFSDPIGYIKNTVLKDLTDERDRLSRENQTLKAEIYRLKPPENTQERTNDTKPSL